MLIKGMNQFPSLLVYMYNAEFWGTVGKNDFIINMSKEGIATCPKCGHQFIVKCQRSGIGGGAIGAIAGTLVTITIGSIPIGEPIIGGALGLAAARRGGSCTCPKCGVEVDRPES